MSKIIIQAVITLFIGLLLMTLGFPEERTDLALFTGSTTIINRMSEISDDALNSSILANGKMTLFLLGAGLSIISIAELFFVLRPGHAKN